MGIREVLPRHRRVFGLWDAPLRSPYLHSIRVVFRFFSHFRYTRMLPNPIMNQVLKSTPLPAASQNSPINRCNLTTDFCNRRGLHSNLASVHHHLESQKPLFLFLSETQISIPLDSTHLQFPNYELHASFRFKGGTCAYVRSDVVCSRVSALESSAFDVLWLKANISGTPIFFCSVYRSPNDDDPVSFFSYLSTKMDFISTTFPTSQVVLVGDFNVHNTEWLQHSGVTNAAGREGEVFAISQGLS